MNDSKNSSNGLLVLKLKGVAPADLIDELMSVITPTAEALGVEPMVLPAAVDVELQMGSSALLERVCVALEALVRQGEAPELSTSENAPQALNARPTGLNSRAAERADHDRVHSQLGQYIANLGKPTDG